MESSDRGEERARDVADREEIPAADAGADQQDQRQYKEMAESQGDQRPILKTQVDVHDFDDQQEESKRPSLTAGCMAQ